MPHEFESGIYAKVPAWHHLGTVWPDLLTTEEAISGSGVDFGVRKIPLWVQDPISGTFVELADSIAVYSDKPGVGDSGVVGVHSPDYEPDGFGDHFRSLGLAPDLRVWECMVLLRHGKIATGTLRLPDLDKILPDGSHYASCLTAYSSHDGTYAISLKDSAYRVECANMLRALDAQTNGRVFRIKHTSQKDAQRAAAVQVMTYAQERADYHEKLASDLLAKHLSNKQVSQALEDIFPVRDPDSQRSITIATNQRDKVWEILKTARDLNGIDNTAWGVLQAVGQFSDHVKVYRARGVDPLAGDAEKVTARNENRFLTNVIRHDSVADKALAVLAAS